MYSILSCTVCVTCPKRATWLSVSLVESGSTDTVDIPDAVFDTSDAHWEC